VSLVTRRVNGGQNGIDDRKVWLRRWKAMFDEADEPPQMPRGAEPQRKAAVRSTIVQGGTVATVAATAVAVKEATQAVTDAANTVAGSTEAQQSAAWSAINFVIGHPTLLLAVVAIVASLYVVYRRYRKLEDEGV
jgi:cobalamin biosynthesis Mg chelatase CobN